MELPTHYNCWSVCTSAWVKCTIEAGDTLYVTVLLFVMRNILVCLAWTIFVWGCLCEFHLKILWSFICRPRVCNWTAVFDTVAELSPVQGSLSLIPTSPPLPFLFCDSEEGCCRANYTSQKLLRRAVLFGDSGPGLWTGALKRAYGRIRRKVDWLICYSCIESCRVLLAALVVGGHCLGNLCTLLFRGVPILVFRAEPLQPGTKCLDCLLFTWEKITITFS